MNYDLISRAEAIDILDAYQVMVENGEENPYAWARLRMSELPPAQPEPTLEQIEEYCHKRCLSIVDNALLHKYAQPETAKRIVGKSKDGMTLWYQCDMCNEPVDAQDNFCSGCGRRLTNG